MTKVLRNFKSRLVFCIIIRSGNEYVWMYVTENAIRIRAKSIILHFIKWIATLKALMEKNVIFCAKFHGYNHT